MLKKISLLLRTVWYLKIRQIIYQIYYRLQPVRPLTYYENGQVKFSSLHFSLPYITPESYKGNNSFIFLNLPHEFSGAINWNFQGYGKLWNYNLQYFNFLHQSGLTNELKEAWLLEIDKCLKIGDLPLEPYPVSLRVINTIRYLSSSQIKQPDILQDTHAQLNYLFHHLEYHLLGNHLLENAFALIMGGAAFEENEWIKKGISILYKELDEQILADGAHFELSVMYHQIILFRVIELIEWYSEYKEHDIKFLTYLKVKAGKMLPWLQNVGFENGDIPYVNDSAPGIAFDSRTLFSFARQLNLPEPPVIPLKESGYRKFETGAFECLVDAGAVAASYQPGHTHADIFSFTLYYRHSPLIVEVGTSTYEKGERRNYERSTSAHNTVEIENQNQFEVWGGFRVGRRAGVQIINETHSSITASHDGYKHLFNIIHERSFFFSPESIRIMDVINNSKSVNGKFYLHFHPDCKVFEEDGRIVINKTAAITFVDAGRTELQSYKFARGYNLYQDAQVLIVNFHESLETLITFL